MSISGKLFGFVGQIRPSASLRSSTTVCPGFCWWYSLQLMMSYETSIRDSAARGV
jgi:hypothetical protein